MQSQNYSFLSKGAASTIWKSLGEPSRVAVPCCPGIRKCVVVINYQPLQFWHDAPCSRSPTCISFTRIPRPQWLPRVPRPRGTCTLSPTTVLRPRLRCCGWESRAPHEWFISSHDAAGLAGTGRGGSCLGLDRHNRRPSGPLSMHESLIGQGFHCIAWLSPGEFTMGSTAVVAL